MGRLSRPHSLDRVFRGQRRLFEVVAQCGAIPLQAPRQHRIAGPREQGERELVAPEALEVDATVDGTRAPGEHSDAHKRVASLPGEKTAADAP